MSSTAPRLRRCAGFRNARTSPGGGHRPIRRGAGRFLQSRQGVISSQIYPRASVCCEGNGQWRGHAAKRRRLANRSQATQSATRGGAMRESRGDVDLHNPPPPARASALVRPFSAPRIHSRLAGQLPHKPTPAGHYEYGALRGRNAPRMAVRSRRPTEAREYCTRIQAYGHSERVALPTRLLEPGPP